MQNFTISVMMADDAEAWSATDVDGGHVPQLPSQVVELQRPSKGCQIV